MSWTILLVAHGTVENLDDMPGFLTRIRRGRPPSPELLSEMLARYRHIGGSPLLDNTRQQAALLEKELDLPVRVAMRLWDPLVKDVCADLGSTDQICLVPLAPFSVSVYEQAARRELEQLENAPSLDCVEAWGAEPSLIDAFASEIQKHRSSGDEKEAIVVTAHSLPMQIIRGGDAYQTQFENCVAQVEARLGTKVHHAYQSEGAGGGEWLGPGLLPTMQRLKAEGFERVIVSPIGFLSEHVETLYDLDVESKLHAEALNLELVRVPAIGTHPGLIQALATAVRRVIALAS